MTAKRLEGAAGYSSDQNRASKPFDISPPLPKRKKPIKIEADLELEEPPATPTRRLRRVADKPPPLPLTKRRRTAKPSSFLDTEAIEDNSKIILDNEEEEEDESKGEASSDDGDEGDSDSVGGGSGSDSA